LNTRKLSSLTVNYLEDRVTNYEHNMKEANKTSGIRRYC